jgi:hypothetical protein
MTPPRWSIASTLMTTGFGDCDYPGWRRRHDVLEALTDSMGSPAKWSKVVALNTINQTGEAPSTSASLTGPGPGRSWPPGRSTGNQPRNACVVHGSNALRLYEMTTMVTGSWRGWVRRRRRGTRQHGRDNYHWDTTLDEGTDAAPSDR